MNATEQVREAVPQPDRDAILAAVNTMFDADDVVELRAFAKGKKRTDAGYFDGTHRDALADAAARLNTTGAAVYVTLNRIDRQLLGRYCNRVETFASATATDANVTRRRWLLLDFDPTRPKDTSATNAQVEAARKMARACHQTLKAEGWPDPLACESGNGWHLVYPLDLPNDDKSRELVKGALASLAARFDDDVVKLDQSVFNAGRIVKLYGTVATKGDHTASTPWRLSRLESTPERGECVTPEQLRTLRPTKKEPTAAAPRQSGFNLSNFLARLGISFDLDQHDGRDRYKLAHCPFNPEHGRGEAAIFQSADGKLGYKCQHSSCSGKTWQDVRALLDGPREARRSTGYTAAPSDDYHDTEADADCEVVEPEFEPGVYKMYSSQPPGNGAARIPRLCVAGGERSNLACKCAESLANDHRVYVRGGMLVRVVTAVEADRGGLLLPQARTKKARSPDALVIVPAAQAWLQTTLTAEPGFFKVDSNGEPHDCDCPGGIAAAVHTLGEWPHIAALLGMATAPFLRADGTVCSADGYDAATRVFLRNAGAHVAIPERPTKDDAVRALGTLLAPFGQFPFADTAHKAAYAALLLTTITRHLYECAPAFMMSAAAPGTGKTLLAECAGLIATGSAVGTRSWPVEPEEMRKTLTGIAVAGDSVVIFDNVVAGSRVSSAPLDQFLTAGTHRDRLLGTTNSTAAPNVATIILTGNNITPRGDMARRTLQVRVVAETENPERRQFDIPDLRQHVHRHRAALVADALTILRAFVVAGAPAHSGNTLGSFEHWDHLVRGALLWVGADDPAQTQTDAMDDDDEQAGARMLLAALKDFQTGRPGEHFTAEAVRVALPTGMGDKVRAAMTAAGVDEKHLGYWLRANRDRPHGGLTFVRVPGRDSAALWRVK